MKLSNGKRAFGYIRVSDPDQVQGYSLEAQESAIRQWCERNGYELVRIFSEEGKSAHVDDIHKRLVFKPMLDAVGRHETDIVVVHTLDRWARNLRIQIEAFQMLAEVGVGFSSVMRFLPDSGLSDGSSGRFRCDAAIRRLCG